MHAQRRRLAANCLGWSLLGVTGLAAALAWRSCSTSPHEAAGPQAGPAASPARRELARQRLDNDIVMRFLFGNYATNRGESRHPALGIARLTLLAPFTDQGQPYQVACVGLHEVDQTGSEVDCQECAAKSAVFVFAQSPSGWYVARYNLTADDGGAYGEPSRPKLIKIGPQRYGILFESGAAFQGHVTSAATLIDLSLPQLPRVLDRLMIRQAGEVLRPGQAAPEPYEYSADLEYVPGANSERFDIVARTRGTRPKGPDSQELAPPQPTQRYVFVCDKYVPVERANPAPSCQTATSPPDWESP